MHPTPPPPTSAGEWAAWVIAVLLLFISVLFGALGYMHRQHTKSQAERIDDMRKTVDAALPSAAALHAVAQGQAVHAERLDAHDDRLNAHDDRLNKHDDRINAFEERTLVRNPRSQR